MVGERCGELRSALACLRCTRWSCGRTSASRRCWEWGPARGPWGTRLCPAEVSKGPWPQATQACCVTQSQRLSVLELNGWQPTQCKPLFQWPTLITQHAVPGTRPAKPGDTSSPVFLSSGPTGFSSRLNQSTNISSYVTLRRGVMASVLKVRLGAGRIRAWDTASDGLPEGTAFKQQGIRCCF